MRNGIDQSTCPEAILSRRSRSQKTDGWLDWSTYVLPPTYW
jgi:hypothetical protein